MRRDYGKVFDIPFNSKNKYQARTPRFDGFFFADEAVPRRSTCTASRLILKMMTTIVRST